MKDKVVIAAVGDIMAGDHQLYWGVGVKSLTEEKEIFVFKYVEKILSEADVVFGNLETVLSNCVKNHCYDSLIFRGNSNFVEQLKKAHFNILNIANNHIQQHGQQQLLNTINLLRRNEINVIGINNLQPQVMVFKDIKLGFLGYSLRPEQYANKAIYSKESEEKLLSDIIKTKEQVDYLAISLHWGDEYVSLPSSWQVGLAHKLVDSGASIILGHHPHVLQGIESYKQGVIVYSLGNFVSDMCQKQAKETMILKLILDGGVSYEIIPCKINNNFQPTPFKGEEKKQSLNTIKKLSNLPGLPQEEYKKLVKNSVIRFRREYRRFLMKNWYKYPIKNLIAIFYDFTLRRLKIPGINQGTI